MTRIVLLLFYCFLPYIYSVPGFISKKDTHKEKVILIACGSFNPPTSMHLRLFEIARDYMQETENVDVIAGIMSPVHETYKKFIKLASNEHRRKMANLTLSSSNWIRLSDFELEQPQWTPTDIVLRYHQDTINSILNDEFDSNEDIPNWLPSNIIKFKGQKVKLRLLCGTDTLDDFANNKKLCTDYSQCEPWHDYEIDNILKNYGLVVVTRGNDPVRENIDPYKMIFFNDLLFKHRNNIIVLKNWVENNLSSSFIRLHLGRGLSVKYLLNDDVLDYIYENKLYGSDIKNKNKV